MDDARVPAGRRSAWLIQRAGLVGGRWGMDDSCEGACGRGIVHEKFMTRAWRQGSLNALATLAAEFEGCDQRGNARHRAGKASQTLLSCWCAKSACCRVRDPLLWRYGMKTHTQRRYPRRPWRAVVGAFVRDLEVIRQNLLRSVD